MFQKVDIIICNREMTIIGLKKEFPTWHILFPISKAYYILELPLGSIKNLKIGDSVSLEK